MAREKQIILAGVALAVFWSAPAWANDAAAEDAVGDDDREIVVTGDYGLTRGTKTETPLIETPQPITAFQPNGARSRGSRNTPDPIILPMPSAMHIKRPSFWPGLSLLFGSGFNKLELGSGPQPDRLGLAHQNLHPRVALAAVRRARQLRAFVEEIFDEQLEAELAEIIAGGQID